MSLAPILLIEGDDYFREYLCRSILHCGYSVFSAKTAEEGLALYKKIDPRMVFLDMFVCGIHTPLVIKDILKIDPEAVICCLVECSSLNWDMYVRTLGAKICVSKYSLLKDTLKLLENTSPEIPDFIIPATEPLFS